MKLYNKTKCPDDILTRLLTRAGRSVGARTSGVVVKVTTGGRVRGIAKKCDWVYEWHLRNLKCRRVVKGKGKHRGEYPTDDFGRRPKGRSIRTDGGYIQIGLPTGPYANNDPLFRAEYFFETAVHEWVHIKDFQEGGKTFSHRRIGGNRPKWSTRPEEIRANCYCKEALDKIEQGKLSSPDEDILALALWLEEQKA